MSTTNSHAARFWLELMVALLLGLTLAAPARAGEAGRVIRLGMQLEPPGLDPTAGASAAISDVAFGTVFEGLVTLGPHGVIGPRLATGWSVSADGRTWRFRLRPGVRFHDGTPFDAGVVKFSLDRARAPDSLNPQRSRFEVIDAVQVVDPLTVDLHLSRRSDSLIELLGWGAAAMVSPRSAATDAVSPVGTGPFRFVRWRRGDQVALARNDRWWRPPPSLAGVVFRFVADPSAALSALRAGDLDGYPAFPAPESVAALRRDPRLRVFVGLSEGKTILALNERSGPLADVRVRRALSHAVDRRALIDAALFGLGAPIGSHFAPQEPGYVDLTGLYPPDPARARVLLAQTGYPHGFAMTIALPPLPYARRSGEVLASQLGQAGVRVTLQNLEWAPWLDQVFTRHAFQATVVAHVEPSDYDIYGRPDYYFGYDSPRVRALLRSADAAPDPARRLALLGDVQRAIAGDAVNVFLFELPAIGVFDARVSDIWAPAPVGSIDLAAARMSGGGAPPESARGSGRVWLWAFAPIAALALWLGSRASPAYLARRAGGLALTLAVASVVVFALVQVAPGDPARYMLGLSGDARAAAALRHALGLEGPAWRRYLGWAAGLLRGDFGVSYTYRVPVRALIVERLAVSLPLTLYALLLSTTLALVGGVWAAARPRSPAARAVEGLSALGLAVPNFWLGLLLALVFAGGLRWFAAGGFPGWEAGVGPALRALTLPAVALALPQAAVLARVVEAELAAAARADHIRTARAKGSSADAALIRHALPNALAPVLTVLGLQFSFLLAGAVIVETVFFLPGLGRLVLQAVTQRDLIVVQSVAMVLVAAVVCTSFLVDLAAAAVDPRLRRDEA